MNKLKLNFTLIYIIGSFWTEIICADTMKWEYFEWPLQLYSDGSEADRLNNRCISYHNNNCGNAATLIGITIYINYIYTNLAPSETTPNKIIGDKLTGTDGFKIDSSDIFSATWRITSFTFMISFKIIDFWCWKYLYTQI